METAAAGKPVGGLRKESSTKYDVAGTPQDCIKRIRELVDVGLRHVIVNPLRAMTEEGPNMLLEQAERVAKEVVPYFR